jgi:imidazolonepropionase-like amidohydrolase
MRGDLAACHNRLDVLRILGSPFAKRSQRLSQGSPKGRERIFDFRGNLPVIETIAPAQIEKAMIVGVKIKEALNRSHEAGVTIAFGTDMGVGPHGQNAREFGFMVAAGMHSREAIKAATVNAAKLLDVSDEVGTIASGKSADVIAVDSSPLDDVSVLQRMAFVMARGDVYLGVT